MVSADATQRGGVIFGGANWYVSKQDTDPTCPTAMQEGQPKKQDTQGDGEWRGGGHQKNSEGVVTWEESWFGSTATCLKLWL